MSRIRTIKPEFWTSEQVTECSPVARLLFIGLWNFCDDAGRMNASPKQIKALVLPADDIPSDDVRRMLDELEDNGLIKRYAVDGKEYLQVTGWGHQKIDRPQPPKFPPPPPPFIDRSTNDRGTIDDGREGKGIEGRGREGIDDQKIIHLNSSAPPPAPAPVPKAAKPFPSEGSIHYGTFGDICREESPGADRDVIAAAFRSFCRKERIPFDREDIERVFRTFAKRHRVSGRRA